MKDFAKVTWPQRGLVLGPCGEQSWAPGCIWTGCQWHR